MPLTLGQLRSELLTWLDETSAAATSSTYLNVTAALKQAHVLRLTEDPWKFMLWPSEVSLTTVANQQVYTLHQEFLRPYTMRNSTRHVWMTETPSRNLASDSIDIDRDVNTDRYTLWGRAQIAAQPTSASVVTIVSSSASDNTSAKAITITGDTANGVTSETLTPNGTTSVPGTVSFTNILSVTKGDTWLGTLTVTSNSGAVTNLTLLAAEYGRSYPQMQLLYLPTAGETIKYRFYRKPREIGSANDITDIPPPFERILIYDALLMMGAYDKKLDGGRMELWQAWRETLDLSMRQTYIEGQSLGAEPRLIGMGGVFGAPRIQGIVE